MVDLGGIVRRVIKKPGYSLVANAIGWPFILYCAASFFSDGINREAAASVIRNTYHSVSSVIGPKAASGNNEDAASGECPSDPIRDDAEKFEKTFAEPFPENDAGLMYSSLQSISSDKLLEDDVYRYISKIMYGTHKEKRRVKENGNIVEKTVDVPNRLSFEELVSRATGYIDYARKAARENNLTLNLFISMMMNESGVKNVESDKGAQGLLQIMPATAIEHKLRHDDYAHDSLNPQKNIPAGAEIVSKLIDKYDGNVMLALVAYNWGSGRVDRLLEKLQKCPADVTWSDIKGPVPKEPEDYVAKVLGAKLILDLFNSELDIKWRPLFSESMIAYEISNGDTFYSVARMFNMHPKSLEKHNKHLSDTKKLLPGEVVYVPVDYLAAGR